LTELPSATETADAIRRGERSAVDVLDRCLKAIEEHNDELNAFVHLDPEGARERATEIDRMVAQGHDPGPFAGVPFGVKDLEDCAGMPTSHGSLLFKGQPPVSTDSVHVGRLRRAGAVFVGKTAAPEFGTIQFTRTKAWGVTRNAWNLERTPGGSSGGSAAAVAGGLVPIATASDGGGSTRIPAAFSGLVGMKPSYGRIPHPTADPSQTAVYGVEAMTVADAARHLDVVSGPHDIDRVSLPPPSVRYEDAIEQLDVGGLRIGWSGDLGFAVVDPEVLDLTRAAAETIAGQAGVDLIDQRVQLTDPVRTWLTAGALTLWLDIDEKQHYPDRLDDLTPYVKYSLEGSFDRPARTLAAGLRRRLQLDADAAAIFDEVDVLITPTTAIPAFAAAGPSPTSIAGEDLDERFGRLAAGAMSVPFTMLANLCWNPACSVPAGLSADGLPVGVQIIGRRHADEVVLRLARLLESARPWPRHAPMGRH
jgi:aspartyl-tRNA(Asn)/glutamyl-tRNA(Gln) amidotransferase subunit A